MRTSRLSRLSNAVVLRNLEAIVARRSHPTAAEMLAYPLAEVQARRLFAAEATSRCSPSASAGCGCRRSRLETPPGGSRGAGLSRPTAGRGRRPAAPLGGLSAGASSHGRERGRADRRGHAPDQGPDRADARPALPAHRAADAGVDRRRASSSEGPAPGKVQPDRQGCVGNVRPSPGKVRASRRSTVKPLSAKSYELHLTMCQEMHEQLEYAQALLSHRIPSGDVKQVLHRALDVLVQQLEKRKFAATTRPRPRAARSRASSPRSIPADVRRAVCLRDRGQCTFVSESGQCCGSRRRLEFDHLVPVARGGQATVENLRLRCRAHNQHEAEPDLRGRVHEREAGAGAARRRRGARRPCGCGGGSPRRSRECRGSPESRDRTTHPGRDRRSAQSRIPVDDARRAAEFSATLPTRRSSSDCARRFGLPLPESALARDCGSRVGSAGVTCVARPAHRSCRAGCTPRRPPAGPCIFLGP